MNKECKFSNCYIISPMGKMGKADLIQVRNTKTVSPDMEAKVIDTYNSGKHILDFEIPRGHDGNIGPTGPEFATAFAYKYSDVGTVINLTKQISEKIPFNRSGDSKQIDINKDDEVIILVDGIYKIEYYYSGSIVNDTAFFAELLKNDEVIDGTTISKDVTTNVDNDFFAACIVSLAKGDVISLVVRTNTDTVLTSAPDTNAYILITKLG